jgi:hypothetical protein
MIDTEKMCILPDANSESNLQSNPSTGALPKRSQGSQLKDSSDSEPSESQQNTHFLKVQKGKQSKVTDIYRLVQALADFFSWSPESQMIDAYWAKV